MFSVTLHPVSNTKSSGRARKKTNMSSHIIFSKTQPFIAALPGVMTPKSQLEKMKGVLPISNSLFHVGCFFQPTTPKKNTPGFLHQRDQNLLKPAEVARRASVVALRCGTCFFFSREGLIEFQWLPLVATPLTFPFGNSQPIDGLLLRTNRVDIAIK